MDLTAATPLERIVFETAEVAVGEWRCSGAHPAFHDTGPIQRHLVAFPRTGVRIRHAGSSAFVTDASMATVYNRGQRYTRGLVDPAGDCCEWWAVSDRLAAEIAAAVDRQSRPEPGRAFRFERAPVDAALYLHQRRLLRELRAARLDDVAAEEQVIALVAEVLVRGARAQGATPPVSASSASSPASHRELAEQAMALMAVSYREPPAASGRGPVETALPVSIGAGSQEPTYCRRLRLRSASTARAAAGRRR